MKGIYRKYLYSIQKKELHIKAWEIGYGYKKWQVTYIAPLNHLPLLPSGPGGVQQELVV